MFVRVKSFVTIASILVGCLLVVLALIQIVIIPMATQAVGAHNKAVSGLTYRSLADRQTSNLVAGRWSFFADATLAQLGKAKLDERDEPILNGSFRNVLKLAAAKLPQDISESDIQRLSFLIRHQFPGRRGKTLDFWQVSYLRYQKAKTLMLGQDQYLAKSAMERLEQLSNLREVFFGQAAARALFEHQYQLMANLSKQRS